jgi:hypothetical protein
MAPMTNELERLFMSKPDEPPRMLSIEALRAELKKQASLIVETGTGGRGFSEVDDDYQERHELLTVNLRRVRVEHPYPWASLWEWYGYYSQELPTYRSRREDVQTRTRVALDALAAIELHGEVHDPTPDDDTPSWEGVNVRVAALIAEFSSALDKDTWQDVGRRSREILIDLGKLIADPALVATGAVAPKAADARAWFDLFLASRALGSEHAELRSLMRAAWDLAQKVTHGDIGDVDAFACAQAVVLLVRTTQRLLPPADDARW